MDKHVFLCETESEYESLTYETPHVALTEDDDTVHYDPPVYKFLDILWSDGTITSEIREPKADLAPIAICVIPTNYLNGGEKARFMSLLYVDKTGNGSTTPVTMNWGPNSPSDDDPLADLYTLNICKNVTNPSADVTNGGSFTWTSTSNTWPDLRYNEEGTAWKNAQQYLSDPEKKYVMGDIDGKGNTDKILGALNFADNTNYAFVNLKNFKPNGIELNWYIPAAGELLNMLFNTGYDKYTANGNKFSEGTLCDIMGKISAKYPGRSASSVANSCDHWSSSPMSATFAAYFYSSPGSCGGGRNSRTGYGYVLAFVQV